MLRTRTGGFPLGWRRGGSDWQKDLAGMVAWAKQNDVGAVDLGRDGDVTTAQIVAAGLRIGSIDLPLDKQMISVDVGARGAAVARNSEYIRACAAAVGPSRFFVVMLPEDPSLPRIDNFRHMVAGYAKLVPVLEETGSHLVIEPWPGPGCVCCTPEAYRALFEDLPSPALGISYDPSHFIRMGIDPLRFLNEFGKRVHHVHGKDTVLLTESLYEYGHELPPIFAERIKFGGAVWRYAVPGHGVVRWRDTFQILAGVGYQGCVSIELEDAYYVDTEELQKAGILQGIRFLSDC